ncbi:hypothetical protein FBU30_010520 [Linnemannia zychae]|nr:hypothetical protein FBU30_010520 [Linnemannia zychae]
MSESKDNPSPLRLLHLSRTILPVLILAWLIQFSFSPKAAYLVSNIRNLHYPIQYHGSNITSNFFEGWYFKVVKLGESENQPIQSIAVIPGIYRSSPSNKEDEHAFVLVVGIPGPEPTAYYRFPVNSFIDLRGNNEKGAFRIQIEDSLFAHDELILNLPANRFERIPARELEEFYTEASRQYAAQLKGDTQSHSTIPIQLHQNYFRSLFPSKDSLVEAEKQGTFTVQGQFLFPTSSQTPLPSTRWMPSIMGFTAYFPFLECNHGVASLHHTVSKGRLVVLHEDKEVVDEIVFDGGIGYTEKDWGINFPSTWISVASIPVLGPDFSDWVQANMPFLSPYTNVPGRLVVFYHAATKTLYNFSSYIFSARAKSFHVTLDIEQRTQTFSFSAMSKDPYNPKETIGLQVNVTRGIGTGIPLRAPNRVRGRMFSGVEEAVTAQTSLRLWRVESGHVLVEDQSLGSGLEVVGDMAWLEAHINQ